VKRVLLISPYSPPITSVPLPIGLLYIASYLRTRNVDVDMVDLNVEKQKNLLERLHDQKPEFVGIYSNISNIGEAKEIAKTVKEENDNVKVVFGGPHPSSSPESYINEYSDAVIVGEGEVSFYEYLKGKITGKIIRTRRHVEDLNKLPFPALDMLDLRKYRAIFYKRKPVSSIITSRGCPYNCIFCDHSVSGYKWRARSPENVVDEINWQINEIGAKELRFYDDNFTLDMRRAESICDLIIKRDLQISWQLPNGIRVDRISKKLLEKMKRAGCWYIGLAPEVGTQKNLNKINKGFDLKKIIKVNEWSKELGYVTGAYFTMGYPFEMEDDLKDTIRFSLEMDPDMIDCAKVIPFKGTPLHEAYGDNAATNWNTNYWKKGDSKLVNRYQTKMLINFYLRPQKILSIMRRIGSKQFIDLSVLLLNERFLDR
jgi:radical SAM superfamily enzyme YgiQ (UPF0313 family)